MFLWKKGVVIIQRIWSSNIICYTFIIIHIYYFRIVKEAFEICDVSNTGKLEIDVSRYTFFLFSTKCSIQTKDPSSDFFSFTSLQEFARWVHKNPKLMNNVFVLQCPKPSQVSTQTPTTQISCKNNLFLNAVLFFESFSIGKIFF